MSRYIFAILGLIITDIKLLVMKIFHFSNLKFSFFNICALTSELQLSYGGGLYIGKKLRMRANSRLIVREEGILQIGDNVFFNYGSVITCHKKIIIGNNVQISPNVLIYDHDHNFKIKDGLKNLVYISSPVIIGNNVWIGANSVILRGTEIGDNSVIAAGSIVKGKIPKGTLVIQQRKSINKVL